MSKTLASILEVGIGIGLEFTPFAPVGTSLILAGTATLVSSLLTSTPKPQGTEAAIKAPIVPRQSGYGEARTCAVWAAA